MAGWERLLVDADRLYGPDGFMACVPVSNDAFEGLLADDLPNFDGESNLGVFNMDFFVFADAVDDDGVFPGFGS